MHNSKASIYDCFSFWPRHVTLRSKFRQKSLLRRGMFDRGPFAHGPVPSKRGLQSIVYFFVIIYRIMLQVPGISCLKYHALCNGRPQMQRVLKGNWKLNELQEVQKSGLGMFWPLHILLTSDWCPYSRRLSLDIVILAFLPDNLWPILSILQLRMKCALLIQIHWFWHQTKHPLKDCSTPS